MILLLFFSVPIEAPFVLKKSDPTVVALVSIKGETVKSRVWDEYRLSVFALPIYAAASRCSPSTDFTPSMVLAMS